MWLLILLVTAWFSVFTKAAEAQIVEVSSVPASAQVAVPRGSSITLTWQVRRENGNRNPVQTIFSNSGTIEIGGNAVATISTVLSQINTTPNNSATTTVFNETLVIPQSVAVQIARNTDKTIVYRRTFADESRTTSAGVIQLVPASGASLPIMFRRIDLTFEDKSRVKVLPSGSALASLAELNFDGTGTAQFEWQIAEPAATRGALVFRRLQVFRRSLAGRGRVTLRSPELPTGTQGLHIVRLVATDPTFDFDPPELKYFVIPNQATATAPAGQRIVLSGPQEGALLSVDTEFTWQRTPGAAVYQLEIYPVRPDNPVPAAKVQSIGAELLVDPDELSRQPVTGIALPADASRARLMRYSLSHLEPGRTYFWRVKAISRTGAVIGTSPLRRISTDR